MAVKIRLARRGRKGRAIYDIVVADSRSPRDGKFIEKIGQYNPNVNPIAVEMNDDRALYWVMTGAQPTDTARSILSTQGIMLKKHLQVGVAKGAITQEVADKRFADWQSQKESLVTKAAQDLAKSKDDKKKAALKAEAEVNAKRAEAIKAKNIVAEIGDAPAEESVEETPAATEENKSEE